MQFEVTDWKENEKLGLRMVSGASYRSYRMEFSLERTPLAVGHLHGGSRATLRVIGRLVGLAGERISAVMVGKMEARLKGLAEA